MTTLPETLVTQEMIDRKDKWSEPMVSPPISKSDIRKWAIAVYWQETPPSLYWDEDYAKGTRYEGIIAPLDFNPFAWPVHLESTSRTRRSPGGGGAGTRGMNGGRVQEYLVPMRPGDVITSTTALVDWNERQTRLGPTLFTISETRWTNKEDGLYELEPLRRR